ncbi:DUF192 domain-containing protein [Halolamina sp.]|uniref:DUF192 domain-containing protein n=1 Tax=Halolamina sp. TaxID=1940283 RepID=UPI000223BC66|nr:protein of unknown function DUF192 [halophilic archaeon DL31]
MRIVHREGARSRVLASDVEEASGTLAKSRGLMFRGEIPEDYAMIFPFQQPANRTIHMLFVRVPLDVLWLVGDEVTHVSTLRPWIGLAHGIADTVIELPEGAAEGVEAGDTVELVE